MIAVHVVLNDGDDPDASLLVLALSVDPQGFAVWWASRMNDLPFHIAMGTTTSWHQTHRAQATTILAATFRANAGGQDDRSLAREVLDGGAAAISNHAVRGPPVAAVRDQTRMAASDIVAGATGGMRPH